MKTNKRYYQLIVRQSNEGISQAHPIVVIANNPLDAFLKVTNDGKVAVIDIKLIDVI